jgi:murein DD-endopeptidase MepM/ murein hydrolase activator NlpD
VSRHPQTSVRRLAPRIAAPLVLLGVLVIVTSTIFQLGIGLAGPALIVGGVALYFVRGEQEGRSPITITPPVRGRWIAINSPADRVPSHGTRELGQAFAIDLVYVPDESASWKGIHRWPPGRRPHKFAGFGQPVLAPADGVVVAASGWQRDHWSRNSPLGLLYLVPEMLLRAALSLLGGHFVLGNHVVLDLGDGVFSALAHLKRGSIDVRRGQHVQAGDQLARCGNSGNTSEPHLHFQLMDHRRPALAAGLPFAFDAYDVGGRTESGVPSTNHPFTVPAAVAGQ